jgi:conjugal transfer pilus assembly protein TraK
MYPQSKSWSSLILLGLLAVSRTDAAQLIENSDTQSVQVNVSARETNRLSIAGRRIANVIPAQAGLIGSRKDEAQGALYFTMTAGKADGPVTVFVADDRNVTYRLILVPRPIPGEDIIVQPPAEVTATKRSSGTDGKAASFQRGIKDLVLRLANDDPANRIKVNRKIPLWQEGTLLLASKIQGTDLVGERYRLTNTSKTDMLIAEQELYRRGVLAVSVRSQTLAPGDSTDIFIVRERGDHE